MNRVCNKKLGLLIVSWAAFLGIFFSLTGKIHPSFVHTFDILNFPQQGTSRLCERNNSTPEVTVDISGLWESNNGWKYNIKQQGIQFTWEVVNKTQKASGTINENKAIEVIWIDSDSKGTASGMILEIDPQGKATFIEWDNGDFFYRETK
jgi:hypothetical protein